MMTSFMLKQYDLKFIGSVCLLQDQQIYKVALTGTIIAQKSLTNINNS